MRRRRIEGVWARLLGLRMALFGVLALPLGWLNGCVMENFPAPAATCSCWAARSSSTCSPRSPSCAIQEEHTDGLPDHSRASLPGYVWRARPHPGGSAATSALFLTASLLISAPIILLSTYLTRYGLSFPGVGKSVTGTFTRRLLLLDGRRLAGGRTHERPRARHRALPHPSARAGGGGGCALLARGAGMVTVAFCFLGLALGAQIAVTSPAIYRFAGPHRRPSYSAVYFSLLGTSYALCPVLAGALLDRGVLSFPGMFAIAGSLALAGWLMFMLMRPPSPTAAASDAPAATSRAT